MRIFKIFTIIVIMIITSGCSKKEVYIDEFNAEASSENEEKEDEEAAWQSTEDTSEVITESGNYSISTEDSPEAEKICVYVCGAVRCEGVYYLPCDAIVMDALNAAGGYSEKALRGYVNLASHMSDSEKIYFPCVDEASNYSLLESEDTKGKEGVSSDNSLVNINSATVEELMKLPGIGEVRAKKIISYREANGSFKSVTEIKKIDGIKDKLYDDIKGLITI